jgi:hypothetical protein
MPPKVPRLRWDDPLRALDVLGSLWSSTGLPSVTAGAAQAAAVPYRTLFTSLQQLLIGKRVTIRMGEVDVTLTVTELDSELDSRGLAVGQLGEVRVAACDIEWGQHVRQRLSHAVAVLRNVHIRPGVPPVVIAAPVELSTALPAEIFDDMLRQAVPQLDAQLNADRTARLHWARRPGWVSLEVGIDVVGTTLWIRPRALVTGLTRQRRWKLPKRTPARPVPLPDLPHGLLVTGVGLEVDSLQISALLPEWRMDLPLRHLEDVISQLSQGALSFAWPSLLRGPD